MSSKTRKLIWSVPLMATLAVVGALAVFVALGFPQANPAYAQSAPAAPGSVMADPGNGQITVSWSVPVPDGGQTPTDYDVEQAMGANAPTSDSGWSEATGEGSPSAVRFRTIESLTNGNKYWFRVSAENGGGEGPWSSPVSATPGAVAPDVPTSLTVVAGINNDELTITWTAPSKTGGSSITGYQVRYRITDTDSTEGGDQPGSWKPDDNGMTLASAGNTNGLRSGTNYTVQVRAVNSEGQSSWTNSDAASTIGSAPSTGWLSSSSDTGSASVKLTLIITLTEDLNSGTWVEIYLEDDYQEPGSISTADGLFSVSGTGGAPSMDGTMECNGLLMVGP